jgi:hypothetical protein
MSNDSGKPTGHRANVKTPELAGARIGESLGVIVWLRELWNVDMQNSKDLTVHQW